MIDPRRIEALTSWCSLNNIEINPQLHIVPDSTGLAVYSGSESIESLQTLVKIPKSAVISVKSCSASSFIESSPYGLETQLALSLALLIEIQLGSKSRWYGYLQSLPETIVNLAIFWNLDNEGQEALQWLKGTEVEPLLFGSGGIPLIDHIRQHFDEVVLPTVRQLSTIESFKDLPEPTLEQFFRAYSLVSSRAFLVDAYHGLSMVPIADAFNHTYDHHIHMETEYGVCPECGSLQQCPHDRDVDMPFNPDTITHPSESEDTCDMVSNTHIPPHSEIFNTYGEHLTNAQLLVQYGFALDVNDNDRVSWRFDDLVRFLDSSSKDSTTTSSSSTTRLELPWDVLVESFDREVFSESELLFDPDTSNTTTMEVFRINCEGKLSWQLWLLIASDRCTRMFPANDIISLLGRLSRYQITLENEDSDRETIAGEDDLSLLLRATQTTIIALCRRRKAGISDGRHLQNQNLGDLVDDLEPSQWRTRLALLQVITELAILDSCEASWQDILK